MFILNGHFIRGKNNFYQLIECDGNGNENGCGGNGTKNLGEIFSE